MGNFLTYQNKIENLEGYIFEKFLPQRFSGNNGTSSTH